MKLLELTGIKNLSDKSIADIAIELIKKIIVHLVMVGLVLFLIIQKSLMKLLNFGLMIRHMKLFLKSQKPLNHHIL